MKLYEHQLDAIKNMKNGCILCGGVGSGKSITSLAYYYIQEGGSYKFLKGDPNYVKMRSNLRDLYIITTARKRDDNEWEAELIRFYLSTNPELNLYKDQKVIVDSWNNIKKYSDVNGAFFIFDEQRVVGRGAWVKTFLKIVRENKWILLSATPGDTWEDYVPVFIANGFFKNRTQFNNEHCVFNPFVPYRKVDRYINTGRLIRLRKNILVEMEFNRPTVSHHETVWVEYDKRKYRELGKDRWNYLEDRPITNASEYCSLLRRIVNSDESRQVALLEILEKHPKAIIFYNYDYELEILQELALINEIEFAEWNGHKHQPVPDGDKWMYLVQYNAGAEGWNCITTDTIIFYSQNYSYKVMTQSSGRIDRLNTPFIDLYYYHFKSRSSIDLAIDKALREKKKFNESIFYNGG